LVLSLQPILPGHERRSTIGHASMAPAYSTMSARCFLISGVSIFWGRAIDRVLSQPLFASYTQPGHPILIFTSVSEIL